MEEVKRFGQATKGEVRRCRMDGKRAFIRPTVAVGHNQGGLPRAQTSLQKVKKSQLKNLPTFGVRHWHSWHRHITLSMIAHVWWVYKGKRILR